MKYIQLIVTGHLEKKALAGSLCKVFDSLLPTTGGERYEWLPAEKINGATGFPLPDLVAGQPHKSMEAMANKMLAALEPGKDRQRQPDLIMLIDDVELGNLGRESVLADHFKAALQSLVQKKFPVQSDANRIFAALRAKCSFHVFKAMPEAYFFADANLANHGAPIVAAQWQGNPPADVETMQTTDPNPEWNHFCTWKDKQQQCHIPAWATRKHPKAYLEHLQKTTGIEYDELDQGATWLQALDWNTVGQSGNDCVLCARALFQDLADWFDVANPLGPGSTHPSFYPDRSARRAQLMLRNM
jgi:hypothetical protein